MKIFSFLLILLGGCSTKYVAVYPKLPNMLIEENCKKISLKYCKNKKDFSMCSVEVLNDSKSCITFYENQINTYTVFKEKYKETK